MNFLSGLKKNLNPLAKLAENTKGFFHNISDSIDKTLHPDKCVQNIIEIIPRIFNMPFPTSETITYLSTFLNANYGSNYFIWNISEESYDITLFNKQVSENCINGYPNPSLHQIFIICFSIISWIKNDKKHIAIIHCQQTKGRSALLFSCLSVLLKYFDHPSEAFLHFCKIMKLNESKVLFPSQEIYMKYFSHIIDGFKMNRKNIKIIKIMFSDIPKIVVPVKNLHGHEEMKQENFRPYLQIFKDSKIIFNSLNNNIVPSYVSTDLTIWFDVNINVKDDLLIRCKHYHNNERVMDLSANVSIEDNFFIDIFFSEAAEQEQEGKLPAEEIESNVKKECNSRLKEKPEHTESEFSQQLSKILTTRNISNPANEKNFSISEESHPVSHAQKLEEEKKEKEEILKTLKEKDEPHKENDEPSHNNGQENDPNKELINKIIEVDHEELEENMDDYISKLEQESN